jgi:hypothetical protein
LGLVLILVLAWGLLRVSLRRRRGTGIALAVSHLVLTGIGWLRRIDVLRVLRIADLQIVVNGSHARHMGDDGLRQFFRRVGGDRSGKGDLALDCGRGDEIFFQGLGRIEGVDHVHFDLPVAALA